MFNAVLLVPFYYSKCAEIVYLTNHMFCVSVRYGFGQGMAKCERFLQVVLGWYGCNKKRSE